MKFLFKVINIFTWIFVNIKCIFRHYKYKNIYSATKAELLSLNWLFDIPIERIDSKKSYIVYSEHSRIGDSNLIQLLFSNNMNLVRIVNLRAPILIGSPFKKEFVSVSSKFSVLWWKYNCYDIKSKIMYIITYAFSKKDNNSLVRILEPLREGKNIIIFPSGVIGRAKWKHGLGQILLEYSANPKLFKKPVFILPVKLEYNFSKRIPIATIKIIEEKSVSNIMTQFIESSYNDKNIPISYNLTNWLEDRYVMTKKEF